MATPDEIAVALVGLGGHVDGDLQRVGEALEAAVVAAALGDGVEAPLGLLDLVARARIDRRVIGDVDDVLADLDQLAADREVVDGAAVVEGVDDRRRLGGEAGEILLHGDAAEVVLAEEGLERDRRRDLAGADQRAGDLVDAAVDLLDEVLGLEEIGDAVEGVVVDQDRAEQGLLGLDVERRAAIGALARIGGGEPAGEIFDSRHGALRSSLLIVGEANANATGTGKGRIARERRALARVLSRFAVVCERAAAQLAQLSPQIPSGEFVAPSTLDSRLSRRKGAPWRRHIPSPGGRPARRRASPP